jgi:hypothetical protein
VDDPVDPAEPLDQRRTPAPHRLLVEQVDRPPVPALAQPQLLAERRQRLLAAVGPRHRRPALAQLPGDQRPEPAADSGDGDHASLEIVHVPILPHGALACRVRQRRWRFI